MGSADRHAVLILISNYAFKYFYFSMQFFAPTPHELLATGFFFLFQ